MPRRSNLHSNKVRCEQVKRSNAPRRSGGLGAVTPTLSELQTALDAVRREVRNLTVMGLDPGQPPDQAALIKQLERSARAEMRLRRIALEYAKGLVRSSKPKCLKSNLNTNP
jgi:hypothetical protein